MAKGELVYKKFYISVFSVLSVAKVISVNSVARETIDLQNRTWE